MAPDGISTGNEWSSGLAAGPQSAYGLWQIQKKRAQIRKEHLDLWESTSSLTGTGRSVDAIISPVAPFASAPHGKDMYPLISVWLRSLRADYQLLVLEMRTTR